MSNILWFVAFEVAYYAAYRYGMLFSQAVPSPFWFPDSVLLCALLKARPRHWWILILGVLPIRLFSPVAAGLSWWFLIGTVAVDTSRSLLAATVLRRLLSNPTRFESLRDLIVFVGVAAFAMPALSAFPGAALRSIAGYDYWQSWESWFLGDALAQLIVTPAIFYWVFDVRSLRRYFNADRVVEAAFLLMALLVTGYWSTHVGLRSVSLTEAALYAPVPFLFWAAIRFGMAGASGGVLIVAIFAVEAALGGHGPYGGLPPADVAFALQSFLLLRSAPLYVVAVAVDQERIAERALRESEERFRKLAESAPILIWMSGTDKLCNYFNRGWLEFTGRTMEQELGNGWAEGVHPDDLAHCIEQYHAAFDARQPFEIDYRLRRHDGEYRWIIDLGVPRHGADGDFVGYLGSAIDITDRKRAEDDHRALAHAQRLAVMGELTATIAHELRQPLSALLLDTETVRKLLAAGTETSEVQQVLEDMRESATRADKVMGQVRTFLGKAAPRNQRASPNDIVQDVLALIRRDAVRRGVKIETDLAGNLPPIVVEPVQIQQVLMNLIVNAMDAMEPVADREHRIVLSTSRAPQDQGVEFRVSDTGAGISSEQMELLFKSFWSTKQSGMGLGLSIARTIVDSYWGRIWAENNPGGGATFRFVLPAAAD